MKITLDYEDRNFFHPSPTPRMLKTIDAILNKFDWQIEIPVEKLTRREAKQLIDKGIKSAKRKKVRLFDTEVDNINRELQFNAKRSL